MRARKRVMTVAGKPVVTFNAHLEFARLLRLLSSDAGTNFPETLDRHALPAMRRAWMKRVAEISSGKEG